MFRLFFLINLFVICCLAKRQAEDRIVGGEDTDINSVPWQVSIQKDGGHFCGGTLINSRTVVTAAHCFPVAIPLNKLKVKGKSSFWRSSADGIYARVEKIVTHSGYDNNTDNNDIAIVTLMDNIRTSYAKLPSANTPDPKSGEQCLVSGWGLMDEDAYSLPNVLQSVRVSCEDRATCNEKYKRVGSEITGNMICAASPNKDACQGDSGGPFICGDGVLIGVVSWGNGCADRSFPGIYTKVSNYLDFIARNTK